MSAVAAVVLMIAAIVTLMEGNECVVVKVLVMVMGQMAMVIVMQMELIVPPLFGFCLSLARGSQRFAQ